MKLEFFNLMEDMNYKCKKLTTFQNQHPLC